MAIEERHVCDIYGTRTGVMRIRIALEIVHDYDLETEKQTPTLVFNQQKDMCNRAVNRAVRFLEKSTSRPSN